MRKKKVTAIIAAGGSGKRLGLKTAKPFIKIAGKPLLIYSLDIFEKSNLINGIVLVVAKDSLNKTKKLVLKKRYKKINKIVTGGSTRSRSVYNGLCAINNNTSIVMVHDVARPFLSKDIIKRCIETARKGISCLAAVPAKDTIKRITVSTNRVLNTPDRRTLWQAQTPQVFDKKVLERAYKKLGKQAWGFKDDASLVEACGIWVNVGLGYYYNIKITTGEDLRIAEALIAK